MKTCYYSGGVFRDKRKAAVSFPLRKVILWTGFGIGYPGAPFVLFAIIRCGFEPLPLFLFCLLFLALVVSALGSTILLDREPNRFARVKEQWLKRFGGINPIESIPEGKTWTHNVLRSSELEELERSALSALAKDLSKS